MPPNVVDLIPWRRGLQLPKLRLHQVNARLSHWYLQTKSSHLCTKKIWRLVTDPQKKNTWSCCRISRSKKYAYTCHLPVPAHRLDLIPQARASNLHIETDKLNTIAFKRRRAHTGNNKTNGTRDHVHLQISPVRRFRDARAFCSVATTTRFLPLPCVWNTACFTRPMYCWCLQFSPKKRAGTYVLRKEKTGTIT